MHRKVSGIDWFIHSLVARDLFALGKLVMCTPELGMTPYRAVNNHGETFAIADSVPVAYDSGTATYSGGWSQTIDDRDALYRRLTKGK